MTSFDDKFQQQLRAFLVEHGQPVAFEDYEDFDYPGERSVSIYGWCDDQAREHVDSGGCAWIIESGAYLVERTYVQFGDTFNGNDDEVGVNVTPVRCDCGRYRDMHLRYVGSLGSVLRFLLADEIGIPL